MTFLSEESRLLSQDKPKTKSSKLVAIPPESQASESDDSSEHSSEILPKVETQKKIIPALGIFLALMSVFCYSMGSALVNMLPELHSIEILVIRYEISLQNFQVKVLIIELVQMCKKPLQNI